MDESRLIEKLRRIEALFSGATTEGERNAAEEARKRIRARLATLQKQQPPIEYQFSLPDRWTRQVFLALLRRYGLRPYRRHGQRYSTVMVMVPQRFVDEVLWPEFQQLSDTLQAHLASITERVVTEVLHADQSEAKEENATPQIGSAKG